MTARELIGRARAAGVWLGAECGRLRYRTPTGALAPTFKAALAAEKPALLRLLVAEALGWTDEDVADLHAERAAIREHEAGFSPTGADRLAWADVDRVLGIAAEEEREP